MSPLQTMAPLAGGDNENLQPEFLRTADVRKVFGIARGSLYSLHALGRVKGVLLRVRGQKSGVRLWSVKSIQDYIRSNMDSSDEQEAA